MGRLFVLPLATVAAMLAAPGAGASGGPAPGTLSGWDGVKARGAGVRYVTFAGQRSSVVAVVGVSDGRVLRFRWIRGYFGLPMVTWDGTVGGLSRDGRSLVLQSQLRLGPSAVSRFAVIGTRRLQTRALVSLTGPYSFDALSPGGRTLYLVEHLPGPDGAYDGYRVRAYDLRAGRLLPGAIVDRREPAEQMAGQPIKRAESGDGRWVYTLYRNYGGEPFVRALDTVAREAVRIDLEWKGSQNALWHVRLALSSDRSKLLLVSANGRVVRAVATPRPFDRPAARAWRTVRAHGLGYRMPRTWDATARSLTPVSDPRQVLAVASYRLPRDSSGADGCQPKEALDRMPPAGAFLFGWEYGMPSPSGFRSRDFPPRSKRFRLSGFAQYECLGPSYMLRFREAGRFFQIHVVIGQKAGPATRAKVLRILDSFSARRT